MWMILSINRNFSKKRKASQSEVEVQVDKGVAI